MSIDVDTLEGIMLFHLEHLNTSGSKVNRDSLLGDALSAQVVVSMSSRSLFKTLVRRDNKLNGGVDKKWPGNWVAESCKSLAPQLL